jgi:hypothetical protein
MTDLKHKYLSDFQNTGTKLTKIQNPLRLAHSKHMNGGFLTSTDILFRTTLAKIVGITCTVAQIHPMIWNNLKSNRLPCFPLHVHRSCFPLHVHLSCSRPPRLLVFSSLY